MTTNTASAPKNPARRQQAKPLDMDDMRQRVVAAMAEVDDGRLVEFGLLAAGPGGGNSGITCIATIENSALGERLIVKIAPPGLDPVRNRDVIRQARLMRALQPLPAIAVPEVAFESAGDPPDVPPFYAMKFVEGEAMEPGLEDVRPPADIVSSRSRAAAAMLADLHATQAEKVGLGDEPEISLSAELERWDRAFGSVEAEYRCDAVDVMKLLSDSMPPAVPTVIAHGDYRLGNMLCLGPNITAIIDWEIWSRTDPRLDLCWMLNISDPHHPSSKGPVDGMPTRQELIDIYSHASEWDIPDLDWFGAMVLYKQASTVALLAKHGRRRADGSDAQFTPLVPKLLTQAREALEGKNRS